MASDHLVCVVLAAGKGTRMKSRRPKVLHEVAGRAMLGHVLDSLQALDPARIVVVVGPDMPETAEAAAPHPCVVQGEQLGTGHAVLTAAEALADIAQGGNVLVVFGDTPLITVATLRRLVDARAAQPAPALVALAFRAADPAPYGRMLLDDSGRLTGVVEAVDADAAQRRIDLCNAGVMLAERKCLFDLLAKVGKDNAKGEYYLPDVYRLAYRAGLHGAVVEASEAEVQGVNTQAELAVVEAEMQTRLRATAMAAGVTLTDPAAVWFSHDTALAPGVLVEPNVVFGPGVSVGEGARIRAFSHLEGARIAAGATVGPYARLRPGTELAKGAKVGNFVEVKNARLGEGAKANHLSYVGDAAIGAGANVGAGTITCNYDGFTKARTEIGAGAFIGSNTALVAPVSVGAGAIVGAGSTITRDVPEDALAVERNEQQNRQGRAKRYRELKRKTGKAAGDTKSKDG